MSNQQPINTSYGLSQAIISNSPSPVIAKRDPNTNDFMQVGTVWCNITDNGVFILASITNNSANWVGVSGASGIFTSLIVFPGPISLTGDTTINGVGNATTNIGNALSTTDIVGTVDINTLGNGITSVGAGGTGRVDIGNATGQTFIDAGNLNMSAGNVVLGVNNAAYVFLNGVKIVSGNGDPNGVGAFTSPVGSLYLNGAPTGANSRLFVNTDGGTTWTFFAANA